MKHKKAIFIIFSFVFLLLALPVKAELRYFRLAYKRCCQFSLNENLSLSTAGKIGPDCDFVVDLFTQGEWEKAGGYFDTPPYGWGGDVIGRHNCYEDFDVSFTCSQPNYQLNSSLPSYVTKTGEEELNSQGSGFAYPKGKRYKFHVSNSAPTSGSFNLSFSFSSDCQMGTKNSSYGGNLYDPAPAVGGTSGCQAQPPININPRQTSLSIPFAITDFCGPTPTPIPTATPIPTSTPIPTATPTATPTPIPPATCACWLLAAEGNPDLSQISKGDLLSFAAEAYVSTPETAEVREMIFVLEHNGSEIANSGTIPAYFNRSEIIGGVNTDVYRSTWSYQVPNTDNAKGLYYLKLIINCGWKESSVQENFNVLGQTQPTPTLEKTGFGFGSLIQRVLELLGLREKNDVSVQTEITPTPNPPLPTIFRPDGKSLQLGTFMLVPTLPTGGCTDLYFQVIE